MSGIPKIEVVSNSRYPLVSGRDGHFLAGFIEAEGSFLITANNGGQNWSCALSLSLRDDDAELLVELRRLTGLGQLKRKSAYRTSKPQVTWVINSRADCSRLAYILEQCPLRGRKRFEFDVWVAAVRELERTPRPELLPRLAQDIRSLKRYVKLESASCVAPRLDDDVVAYFGGFFTGEGYLHLSGSRCRLAVRLRDDDRPLLEELAAATGLGRLYASPRSGSTAPSVVWTVYRRDQLAAALQLLSQAGLRGRKSRELAAWRPGALEFADAHTQGRRPNTTVVEEASRALLDARKYRPGAPLDAPSPVERQVDRCLEALHQAARATSGPFTVTAYSAQRRANPAWPNRDTVVRVFGSWSEALNAAGLASRRDRAPRRSEPKEFTWPELEERLAGRNRVIALVAQLATGGDRSPTVHDYLAWRAEHDRSLPCLSKLYDLFPGGWSSVRTVARA